MSQRARARMGSRQPRQRKPALSVSLMPTRKPGGAERSEQGVEVRSHDHRSLQILLDPDKHRQGREIAQGAVRKQGPGSRTP